jgi:hypothetical protein
MKSSRSNITPANILNIIIYCVAVDLCMYRNSLADILYITGMYPQTGTLIKAGADFLVLFCM